MAWLTQTARKQADKTMAFFPRLPSWNQGFKLSWAGAMRVSGL